jgi:hypothetical protein
MAVRWNFPGISTPTSRLYYSIEAFGDLIASGYWLDMKSAVLRSQNWVSVYLLLPLILRNILKKSQSHLVFLSHMA